MSDCLLINFTSRQMTALSYCLSLLKLRLRNFFLLRHVFCAALVYCILSSASHNLLVMFPSISDCFHHSGSISGQVKNVYFSFDMFSIFSAKQVFLLRLHSWSWLWMCHHCSQLASCNTSWFSWCTVALLINIFCEFWMNDVLYIRMCRQSSVCCCVELPPFNRGVETCSAFVCVETKTCITCLTCFYRIHLSSLHNYPPPLASLLCCLFPH